MWHSVMPLLGSETLCSPICLKAIMLITSNIIITFSLHVILFRVKILIIILNYSFKN